MINRAFVQAFWWAAWCFWVFVLILAPTIAIKATVSALRSGEPMPWSDIGGCIGIMLAATIITWLIRRWSNFLVGTEICKWRLDR